MWPVLLFCIVSILLSLLILWVVSVISVVILILPAVSSVIFLLLFLTVHGDRAQETGVRRLLQAVRCRQRVQRHEGSWDLWECAAYWEIKPRWASLLGFKYCHFKLRYHMEFNIWYDGVSISINVLLFFSWR